LQWEGISLTTNHVDPAKNLSRGGQGQTQEPQDKVGTLHGPKKKKGEGDEAVRQIVGKKGNAVLGE